MIPWILMHFLGICLHRFMLTSFYRQNIYMRVTIRSRWITALLVMITSRKTPVLIMTMLQQMSITTKIIAVFLLNKNSAYVRSVFLLAGLAFLNVVFNKKTWWNIEFILTYLSNLFFQSYMKLLLEFNCLFNLPHVLFYGYHITHSHNSPLENHIQNLDYHNNVVIGY